jgi:dTDP-4-amino-4,6-dideoxygalactose transaminase
MKTQLSFEKAIYVTKPFLPSFDEFSIGLKEIWNSHWLTNNGPMLCRFERILSKFYETENLCLFNNGTLALQLGLHGMGISGEVITTPFTFAATSHALFWNKLRPVFADIESDYYTLDPLAVESAITPSTSAILAVHVYGYPCRLKSLSDIARRHNLVLIYDSAHAFGVSVDGKLISNFGDMSMFSFHATKLFHSIEGGMLIFRDSRLKESFNELKNFGFRNDFDILKQGTNAKMNEMQALMGILVFRHFDDMIKHCRILDETYRENLKNIPGIKFPPKLPGNIAYNYSYQPVEIDREEFGMSRDALYQALKLYNIHTRRYFYPLLCDFSCYRNILLKDPLTVARRIANRILCLPNYFDLSVDDVVRICEIIQEIQSHTLQYEFSLERNSQPLEVFP